MKNIIRKPTLLFTFFLLFSCIQAQTIFNNDLDRTEYLKTFEINKSKYIGKPFSVLLADIKLLQPKTCFSRSAFTNKYERIFTRFFFVEKSQIRQSSPVLSLDWQTPIPIAETNLLEKKNNYSFTSDEKTFYESKIIKDIKVN